MISLDALDSSPQDFPKSLATGYVLSYHPSLAQTFAIHGFAPLKRQELGLAVQTLMIRQTDKDGRCTSLLEPSMKLSTGVYKLVFHTGEYFSKQGVQTLYPFVEVRLLS